MRRSIAFRVVCLIVLLASGNLAWSAEKDSTAKKSDKPAAKKIDAPVATKSAKSVAKKSDKPAAKKSEKSGGEKTEQPIAQPKKEEAAAKKAESPAPAAPATHTVKKSPLRIVLDLDGVFEPKEAREILIKPEEWTSLVVRSAVAHGARVRKGDVLLSLETDKLDRVIADLRTELKLVDLSIRQGEEQLVALDKVSPLELEAGQRAARTAEEDRTYFLNVERPFVLKAVDFSLKMSEQALEYQEEELHQLEKMYKADDITEETEEIVLKRARDNVERARFMVDYAKLARDQVLKMMVPRREDAVKESAQRRALDWDRKKADVPLAQQRQRLELERLRLQRGRSDERLKDLTADRKLMTIESPSDGIVYYGKRIRGRFSDSTGMGESLRPNGAILPNQVVMTIVQLRPMFIRASVSEQQLYRLRPGLKGVATPTGYPKLKLTTTLDDVSDIPIGPGSFDARFRVDLDRKGKSLMPGMTCKIRLVPYLRKDSLTVPPKVVNTDELDDQKQYVYVLDKNGKPQRRDVTVGEKTAEKVEILKGLSEGEKVLLEPPKEDK